MFVFLRGYLFWHYGRSFKELVGIWGNMMWFGFHLFSVRKLLSSFFEPLNRLHEEYPKNQGFDPSAIASAFIVNSMMRLIGMIFRAFLIALGLATELLLVATGVAVFVGWLLFPIVIVLLVSVGVSLLAL